MRTALLILALIFPAFGAAYRTTNFTVTAPSDDYAKQTGDAAEFYRAEIAKLWLGKELPAWSKPCPIEVQFADGNGGSTSFVFDKGEVGNWNMSIQGTPERLIDSVLPHEVNHTIFASHFREPLPRWADEGACSTVEHQEEAKKLEQRIVEFLKTGRCLPFDRMLATEDYPADVMPLYAQGHSVTQWLVEKHGREKFIAFLTDGLKDNDWQRAIADCYGFQSSRDFQEQWLAWIKASRPVIGTVPPVTHIAYQCGDDGCSTGGVWIGGGVGIQRQPRPYRQTPQLRPIPAPRPQQPPAANNPPIPAQAGAADALILAALAKIELRLSALESKQGERGPVGPAGPQGPPGPAGSNANQQPFFIRFRNGESLSEYTAVRPGDYVTLELQPSK